MQQKNISRYPLEGGWKSELELTDDGENEMCFPLVSACGQVFCFRSILVATSRLLSVFVIL